MAKFRFVFIFVQTSFIEILFSFSFTLHRLNTSLLSTYINRRTFYISHTSHSSTTTKNERNIYRLEFESTLLSFLFSSSFSLFHSLAAAMGTLLCEKRTKIKIKKKPERMFKKSPEFSFFLKSMCKNLGNTYNDLLYSNRLKLMARHRA